MIKSKDIFIGLGSNLGDRRTHLNVAMALLEERVGRIEKKSSIYRSPPWGFEAKEDFYNMVVQIKTDKEASIVLNLLKEIELSMGRIKITSGTYESRVIDLDIIDFEGIIFKEKNLVLPHAQLHLRKFVLVPLHEIAPRWIHPILNQNCTGLLKRIDSNDFIEKLMDTND